VGGTTINAKIHELNELVEKPAVKEAPSNLAIAGRYILTPDIFKALEQTTPGKNGEIQLTDALRLLLRRQSIYSYIIEGKRYDIGNKLDYLKTSVEFALKRPEFSTPFAAFLKEIVATLKD
jgi:UTP--glucose-1-phosphate uridylyltransferase